MWKYFQLSEPIGPLLLEFCDLSNSDHFLTVTLALTISALYPLNGRSEALGSQGEFYVIQRRVIFSPTNSDFSIMHVYSMRSLILLLLFGYAVLTFANIIHRIKSSNFSCYNDGSSPGVNSENGFGECRSVSIPGVAGQSHRRENTKYRDHDH